MPESSAVVIGAGFVVVIEGMTVQAVIGPFTDRAEADRFARFATREIDPARVFTLCSPVTELLNWRRGMLTDWGQKPELMPDEP